jgi:hypothetical protein
LDLGSPSRLNHRLTGKAGQAGQIGEKPENIGSTVAYDDDGFRAVIHLKVSRNIRLRNEPARQAERTEGSSYNGIV